ncbi:hypothetical protein GQ44DRAFT_738630 [Phaeosphaeriaceae sp. PMI808]|nr:hypothetical protein GQ44DRAFT_738630 [Phaeosphaeriaceae sp. PMI808]
MAPAEMMLAGYIKIEDSPSPEPKTVATIELASAKEAPSAQRDPRDPEGFLKRCSGFNKKTKLPCNSSIGKKSEQSGHLTFLPTCRTHRDQRSRAGWCKHQHNDGSRCGILFKWTPPYFELCSDHQGHPNNPCYYFRLPLELRHQIFSYLLPNRPIGSSTAALHDGKADHLLFSSVLFTIDVRKDGAFMCGRRLLEPRRADGSSHYGPEKADEAKQLFLKNFDFSAVKHYAVDILVENWKSGILYPPNTEWDEEVELYDIRDYISVVVSGVLAKSRKLCKLQVRVCLADFDWSHEQTLENTKLIVGPFESLRKVENPRILSICAGRPNNNSMLTVQRANASIPNTSRAPICSVPSIPTHTPVLAPGMPDFDAYASSWSDLISQDSASPITTKPPIRAMFTAFKDFYTELSIYAPEVTYTHGRHAFLHRARVAREQEDVEAFRVLRNDLIQHWFNYQEREERTRTHMNARLTNLLETDLYPSHEWDENKRNPHQEQEQALCAAPSSSSSSSSSSRRPSYPTQQRKLQHDQQQQYQQQQGVGEEGGAGPSMKKRRVGDWMSGGGGGESNTEEVTYIGKGKGKRVSGVICID